MTNSISTIIALLIKDSSISTNRESGDAPIMKEEFEEAVNSLKAGKSPGVDNVPAELLKHAGPELVSLLVERMDAVPHNTHLQERNPETISELQNY